MKRVIVTTTINPITEALRRFQQMHGWELVVVGDLKTPKDYRLDRGIYLSPEDQNRIDSELSELIGWNCIQRRNFGLIQAARLGADIVALVDDDNIPLPGWGEGLLLGRETELNYYETDLPAFDPLGVTNHAQLWHRGYPLELLSKRGRNRLVRKVVKPNIQADLWNGDPDVDAFCRMQYQPKCEFHSELFPLGSNRPSPFNSQNTFVEASILPDYFLFPHVGRMDDIWAAYYVQGLGAQVVYGKPSVQHVRNPHNPVADLEAEWLGYKHNLEIVSRVAQDPDFLLQLLPVKARQAFDCYRRHFGGKSGQ